MPYGRPDYRKDDERLRQMAADCNDLLRREGSTAKPVTRHELARYGLGILFAWHDDIARRRREAGLPEHVNMMEDID